MRTEATPARTPRCGRRHLGSAPRGCAPLLRMHMSWVAAPLGVGFERGGFEGVPRRLIGPLVEPEILFEADNSESGIQRIELDDLRLFAVLGVLWVNSRQVRSVDSPVVGSAINAGDANHAVERAAKRPIETHATVDVWDARIAQPVDEKAPRGSIVN